MLNYLRRWEGSSRRRPQDSGCLRQSTARPAASSAAHLWFLFLHRGCLLTVLQAIIHPDTNETIFMPFRMSGRV